MFARGVLHQRDGLSRQAVVGQCAVQAAGDGDVAVARLRTAAQEHRVSCAQAQRSGIGGHVRAGLVDHRDQAQRDPHLLDHQPIGPGLATGDLADGVGQRGHFADRGDDAVNPAVVELEPVEHGAGGAVVVGARHVAGVGLEDAGAAGVDRVGHGRQQPGAPGVVKTGDGKRRGARALGE